MISYSDWLDNNIDRLSDKYDTYLEEFEDMLSEIEDRAYDDYKDERL